MSVEETYNKFNFVSPCCKAFNYYDNNSILCSKCGKIIQTYKGDESLTINVKFNTHDEDDHNVSGDLIKIFNNSAKKFAHDPTCEKNEKNCPKCDNNVVIYLRNPQDELVYVCTKCRTVFDGDNVILA